MQNFRKDISEALGIENKERFVIVGFVLSEKKGVFLIEIKAKLTTIHGETVNVSSGKMEYEESMMEDDLYEHLIVAREEMFKYMFEDKNAQQKLDFKE